MAYSSRESTKGKGIKGVDNLGVGVFYYYSNELDQRDGNDDKAVSDKRAEAMAQTLDNDAGGELEKLKKILASKDRHKIPGYGVFVTVKYRDGDLWILA